MTPILSRPSIAKQYSSPSNSPHTSRDHIEMQAKRESGLINAELACNVQQETPFTSPDFESDESYSPLNSQSMDIFPHALPPQNMLPTDNNHSDVLHQDIFPPDVLPPNVPPPNVPPPNVPPPNVPPPNVPPPNVPPPNDLLPEIHSPAVPSPNTPPSLPSTITSLPTASFLEAPSQSSNDSHEIAVPPVGFELRHLEISKQQGKKGIGITLSSKIGHASSYLVVKRLLPGSIGGKCGLKIGDRIASINDQDATGLTSQEAMATLVEAPKSFNMIIFRDPDFNSESTPSLSSTYGQSVTYTESISSLLSDEEFTSTRQLQELQSAVSAQQPSLPAPPDSPAPSPPSTPPPPTTTPPPLPYQKLTSPATPPPLSLTKPIMPSPSPPQEHAIPPEPTTPPPSPPIERITPLEPTTPPPSPPMELTSPPEPKISENGKGPFTVKVTKGLFSLGLTTAQSDVGLIEVKAISSRSPLAKEGSLQYVVVEAI